jgi:hypothetical protein
MLSNLGRDIEYWLIWEIRDRIYSNQSHEVKENTFPVKDSTASSHMTAVPFRTIVAKVFLNWHNRSELIISQKDANGYACGYRDEGKGSGRLLPDVTM